MKAYFINRYKRKESLQFGEMPEPTLGENDVLIGIHAASINQLDAKIRDGEFKLILPYNLPLILGQDVAGVVVRVGSRVTKFTVGDQVYARPDKSRIGTFAELIALHETDVALKPKNLSLEEAASLPLVALTAWQVLVERGKLKKGQKVFIQAGSGGVGTIAIQLAKHLGATVATTTSASNVDLVKRLGADVVIDYKSQQFETILSDVTYSFLFMKASGSQLARITALIESGSILPVIDRVYPFKSTNEALAYVESGRSKGKVVVKIK